MSKLATYGVAILILAGFLWFAQDTFTSYRQQLVVLIAINTIVAVSLTMASGFTGVFSLGQVGFMAIAAYVGALISLPLSWKDPILLPGLPGWRALAFAGVVGGLVAMVVAVVVGYPLMRLSGNYVAVATMGFLIIVYTVLIQWDSVTYGSQGLNPIPTYTNVWSAYFWAVLTIYVAWRIRRSSFGRSMIASRDNLIAARAVGVRVHRARLLAFTVCGFLTGVGGCLLGHQLSIVSPSAFYFTTTFNIIIMVVLGGLGSITGAIFGAIFMTLAPEVLRNLETNVTIGPIHWDQAFGLQQIILALIFIAVMILRPSGLMAGREIDLAWWQNRRRAQSE
jgi:branched-chain amino acid transport system permease protein